MRKRRVNIQRISLENFNLTKTLRKLLVIRDKFSTENAMITKYRCKKKVCFYLLRETRDVINDITTYQSNTEDNHLCISKENSDALSKAKIQVFFR